MGEEKKEEEKKKEEGEVKKETEEKKDEEKKKEEEEAPPPPPPEIVLKVDMHCEACARKVARALKGFEGVEEVRADSKTSKVVVKGKTADPLKVWERLQKKSGRKVELISPLPKPPEDEKETKVEDQPTPKEEPKEPEKKDEPPPVVTVVLSIRMHCEACAQVLQKRIRKIPGVETVETDIVNGTVTVKGVVEPGKLAEIVYKKTKKQVSIVNKEEEKKEEGEEKKKKEEEEEKKKKEEEEEEKKKKEEGGGEQGKTEELLQNEHEIKRSEYWPSRSNYSEFYTYPPPQMFSDENPNACSVM